MLLQGFQGATGKQTGQNIVIGLGEFSDLLATELMARYYEQTYRGNVYGVSFAAAALAAPSASATGAFALWNPVGNKFNLVLLSAKIAVSTLTAVTTATAVGLVPVANQSPTGSPGAGNTPQSSFIGSGNKSTAATYVSGTLSGANTTALRLLTSIYADLAAGDIGDTVKDEIAGSIIIAPNSGVTLAGIGGTPADLTIAASFEWMEIPQ